MLVRAEVNRELKFTAKCNEGTGEVSARDRGAVPCVEQKEDRLHSHADGIAFVRHNL